MLSPYQRAFLDAVAGGEAPGYDYMYGGGRFTDYGDHPRQYIPIRSGPNAGQKSSAAGRYQFLANTWDEARNALGLSDFSPSNQDTAAWWLADKTYRAKTGRGLEDDLRAGKVAEAAPALSGVWTSLPGGIEPNDATSGFTARYNASLAGEGPLSLATNKAPTQGSQPMAQQDQGSLASQFIAGGPGALFGYPQNDDGQGYDWGNRLQQAAAFIGSIGDPKFLSILPALQKQKASGTYHTIKDAAGNERLVFADPRSGRVQDVTPGSIGQRPEAYPTTPGQKAVDSKYAEDFLDWTTKGGMADTEKGLKQLEEAAQMLRSGKSISGPVVGSMPDAVNAAVAPDALKVRDRILEVGQRSLRQVLGSQFTQKEGEMLLSRVYNPLLNESENAARLDNLIAQLRATSKAKQEAADYYRKNGTLTGWQGRMPSLSDFDTPSSGMPAGVTIRQVR